MQITKSSKQHILSTLLMIIAVLFLFGTPAQAAKNYTIYSAPTSLSFSVQPGGAATAQSVNIDDSTPGPLPFTISADQAWITVSTTSSTTQRGGVVVQFGVNPAGLAAGSYSGHVILTASGVTDSPLSIPVSLTVTSGASTTGTPYVIRAISSLTFTAAAGKNPAAQSVTSSDTSPIAPTYTVSTTASWLTATHVTASGSSGYVIPVSVSSSGLAAGSYSGTVIITIANQSGYTWTNSPYAVPVTLTVTSGTAAVAPTITTQPASQTITAGQTATFNVASTGTAPMTYQWMMGGTAMSGATSSSFTTPAEMTANTTAQVTVMVSNSAGSSTSSAATLTVNAAAAVAPSITTQPASQSIASGKTATFSVAATGTAPMTYQWKNGGSAISGATSSTYTTPAETVSGTFSVTVTNSAGSATSSSATVTVTAGTLVLNSSSSALAFGNVNVSSSSSQTVTLTNAGNSNVTISGVSISGAGFNASGVSTGLILTPGQTATLTATFDPSAAGSATGSVAVASNATNSPDSVTLSGTGVAVATHSVALSWTASTSTVTGYNTYSSTTSGGPYTKLNSSPSAGDTYTDTTVQAGLTYYYVVTAVNSSDVESLYSTQISASIP